MSFDPIESISVIPNSTDSFDEVWAVINRANGRFVERMTKRLTESTCGGNKSVVLADQIFLDSALSYDDSIDVSAIDSIGASTLVSTESAHGFSSGDIIVLSCAGEFDGRFKVEELSAIGPLLYLKGNGTDGSTTITDSSSYARTVTAVNDAQIDTAEKFLGVGSIKFDGTGDYIEIATSDDFEFSSNPSQTIEMRVMFNALPSVGLSVYLFSMSDTSSANHFVCRLTNVSGDLKLFINIANTLTSISDQVTSDIISLSTGVWYHIVFVVNSIIGSITGIIFLDGEQIGSDLLSNTAFPTDQNLVRRMGSRGGADSNLNGWLDEVLYWPFARYTAEFTPPTTEFSSTTQFHILHATLGTPIDSSTYTDYIGGGRVGLAANQFTGLDHLEGETVGVLGDGEYLGTEEVSGGSISLASEYATVHVGLPYNCDVITQEIETP